MDDKTQKERLEQELRFLKESFEAEVISKEEFEKGSDRIEKKLKEIKKTEKEHPEEKQELAKEQKKDDAIENIEAGKIKLRVIQDEPHEADIQTEEIQETWQKEILKEDVPEKPKWAEEQKKESKLFRYAAVFVVLMLVLFFSYSLFKPMKISDFQGMVNQKDVLADKKITQEPALSSKFAVACGSNDDCGQEGKEGKCLEPGTKNAKCEFKEISKTNVIVLNDRKDCFNCDAQRVLGIIEGLVGSINSKEIDYNTAEGKNIAEKFDAKALPLYLLEENITKKPKFEEFKRLFAKKDGNYVLNEDVAAPNLYIKREVMQNKLDFFAISDDNASIRAEKNLNEFLETFHDVKFNRHLSKDKLAEELNIRTFPAFLVNNRVRFSGVHSAETIKENFCKLNKLPECEKSLSKSLV